MNPICPGVNFPFCSNLMAQKDFPKWQLFFNDVIRELKNIHCAIYNNFLSRMSSVSVIFLPVVGKMGPNYVNFEYRPFSPTAQILWLGTSHVSSLPQMFLSITWCQIPIMKKILQCLNHSIWWQIQFSTIIVKWCQNVDAIFIKRDWELVISQT